MRKLKDSNGEFMDGFLPFNYSALSIIVRAAFGGDFDVDWMQQRWIPAIKNFDGFMAGRMIIGTLIEYFPLPCRYLYE